MAKISRLNVFVLSLAVATLAVQSARAQTYPTDEASLYEAAKKEGTVVFYSSAPLEAMQAVDDAFEKDIRG